MPELKVKVQELKRKVPELVHKVPVPKLRIVEREVKKCDVKTYIYRTVNFQQTHAYPNKSI